MFKQIQPFYIENFLMDNDCMSGRVLAEKEYYRKAEPFFLDLGTIKQVRPVKLSDGSGEFTRLVVSNNHTNDIIVSKEEGDEIVRVLLKKDTSLADEIHSLMTAVRDLWNLLRARMH